LYQSSWSDPFGQPRASHISYARLRIDSAAGFCGLSLSDSFWIVGSILSPRNVMKSPEIRIKSEEMAVRDVGLIFLVRVSSQSNSHRSLSRPRRSARMSGHRQLLRG